MIKPKNRIMADIRVEKKKPVWPWLFLVIVLAVIIFLYFYGSIDTEEEETDDMNMETEKIDEVTSITPDLKTLQIKEIRV